ncbi:hypothetical protein A5658_12895 [Mycobacterium sp. 1245111.1]|uniref:hypothetical protein n=1 Tax=Mycobacterium sp. 1245111.1 TaxID=1834073 RepID=UPI0007FEA74E|nr:hypothetical protein [Mycobacterium sp. 1245111.1]OBK33741.1 hypothetical protein A5658_12895 [Mycobacterium sp. 1245111.1]
MKTWTFVGHWDNDEIVVEHIVEGVHEDKRIDTGFWEQGLFAAPAAGETVEQAEAALRAEYES